jgi:acetylornithine deacetylase
MNLFRLTRELIDIPSVTGDEGRVGEFLSEFLLNLGYRVGRQEVAQDRFNVIATTQESPRIVFSTHMDTGPRRVRRKRDHRSADLSSRVFARGRDEFAWTAVHR